MFEPRGGKYMCHSMLAGAVPVPMNAKTGKREVGGYEFFYQGWKNDNPTRENCRFGASREIYSLQIEMLHWMEDSSRNWDLQSRGW